MRRLIAISLVGISLLSGCQALGLTADDKEPTALEMGNFSMELRNPKGAAYAPPLVPGIAIKPEKDGTRYVMVASFTIKGCKGLVFQLERVSTGNLEHPANFVLDEVDADGKPPLTLPSYRWPGNNPPLKRMVLYLLANPKTFKCSPNLKELLNRLP